MIRSNDAHYVWMEMRFNSDRMWVWIVNLVVYVGVIVAYFCIEGHELVYSIYVPLDILLNVSKMVFYFYYYLQDRHERKKLEELRESLKSKIQNDLKLGLFRVMTEESANLPSAENADEQKKSELQLKFKYQEKMHLQKKR